MTDRPVGDPIDRALRVAVRALAEAAPQVDELPDLLGSRSEPERPGRARLVVSLGLVVGLALLLGVWWTASRSNDQFIASNAESTSCPERQRPWCADDPKGIALVDGTAWTVDGTGHLVGLDADSGARTYRSSAPIAPGSPYVLGEVDGGLLIGAGEELILTDDSGNPAETYRPRPGWTVVDADGATPTSLFVVLSRADERDLVAIEGGEPRALLQEIAPESVEVLADGRVVAVDSTTRELVMIDVNGAIAGRLFTRMPEGSIAAHRSAIVVLPATGGGSSLLWLAVDDGTVVELSIPGFNPGQPIAADMVARDLATVDSVADQVTVASVPNTEFDS